MNKKKVVIGISILLGLLLISTGLYVVSQYNSIRKGTVTNLQKMPDLDTQLTKEEVLKDYTYFANVMHKKHPAWLETDEERLAPIELFDEAFDVAYEKVSNSTKESYSVLEVWQNLSEIIALLRDGHSRINYFSDNETYIDDVRQLRTYGVPLSINGVPSEDLYKTFKKYYSHEREEHCRLAFENNGTGTNRYLRLCGLDTSQGATYVFNTPEGTKEYTYTFVPWEQVNTGDSQSEETITEEYKWVSFEIDSENNIGIFILKECIVNEEYHKVLHDFFIEIAANKIKNVIVDLRGNGGGNSLVGNKFIEYLPVEKYQSWDCFVRSGDSLIRNINIVNQNDNQKAKEENLLFTGNLYVLTNINTYSAAMDFAMLVKDNNLGVLVGETSGNNPNSYGDVLSFQLPYSRLYLGVSFKRWFRVDKSKGTEPLIPDYQVPSSKALEKVYELCK